MAKLKEILQRRFNILYCALNKDSFESVEKYRNIASMKSCCIVGSGPSLCVEDLELLYDKGIPCFGTNRLYKIYSDTRWRADYYAIFDQGLSHDRQVISEVASYGHDAFFINKEASWEVRTYGRKICPVMVDWSRDNLINPQFSMDCAKRIFGIGTVTYCCMQLAYYMGFRKIYLIGMDNKYTMTHTEDGRYFKEIGRPTYFSNLERCDKSIKCGAIWEMNIGYDYAERISERLGFKVYNSTRGGHLETFKRIRLEDWLNE